MSSLHTNTVIYLGAQKITSFLHLQIVQSVEGHHRFELQLSQKWFSKNGDGTYDQVKKFFGTSIRIEISPEINSNKSRFYFGGIVTRIITGSDESGNSSICTISGYSPTYILDDNSNIQTFEDRDQAIIFRNIIGKYHQNLIEYSLDPKVTESMRYVVQYKESSWSFLRRLASQNGEWFFYDGNKLIYGKHVPEEVKLFHLRDLSSFNIQMEVQPANQTIHTYDYESHKPIEVDTVSQNTGTLNQISQHLLKSSDSLYLNKGLTKVNQEMNGSAQEELRHLAIMERGSKIANMVSLVGTSSNLALKVGMVVNILDDFKTNVDHGKFFITNLTHICDGNGNYSNHFTGIPSDAAVPFYQPDLHTHCEAQSAIVIENYDKEGLGRIRVRFHWQNYGMSPWIRILSPSGGSDKGFYFIPEKNEEVMVDFEGGNAELPYMIGSTYNGKAKTSFGNKENDLKVIKTRSGHMIKLDDKDGSEKITISDKSGTLIQFDTNKKSLVISAVEDLDFSAKNIKMSAKENITIGAEKDIELAAKKNLSAIAEGPLALQSKKDITAKASGGLTLEATKDTLISGKNVTTEATANLELGGGAQTKVSGKMTSVQGAAGKTEWL